MSQKVTVDAGALQMVINALRKDAEEGKVVRGEMVDELLKTVTPVTEQKEAYGGNKSPEQLITYHGTMLSMLVNSQRNAFINHGQESDNLRHSVSEVIQGIIRVASSCDLNVYPQITSETLPGPDVRFDMNTDPYFHVDTILDYLVDSGLFTEGQRLAWLKQHFKEY